MMRARTRRWRSAPTAFTSCCCSTRSSLAWTVGGASAISSRRTVPSPASANSPGRSRSRPGERAAQVAEQLALEQRLGDGGTVLDQERRLASWTPLMDGAGEQLLAGAGLALDQDGDGAATGALDQRQDGAHGARAGDQGLSLAAYEERSTARRQRHRRRTAWPAPRRRGRPVPAVRDPPCPWGGSRSRHAASR